MRRIHQSFESICAWWNSCFVLPYFPNTLQVDGDRGSWLYRGYLVGNTFGHLAGRWRDTLSPVEVDGYEGCFAMSRRG